ncbi:DUF2092 domain-containing protein [Variovorax dokdonensis]|uniref:DUF2092 domain-containing protein n=1 Tax=Variovorax dokdonensis TaxID=344883 RepID=A0ABT7ND62_9BURK|nr:DUF2092 domain-containing protein [Variovorax dokdonensis]MDM0045896.1 DUF2092 domain-containing protein [Variovorax dokdonensis]
MPLFRLNAICLAVLLSACASSPPSATGASSSNMAGSMTSTGAVVAPQAATASANAVDPAAVQAVKSMSSYLQTLQRFAVTVDLTGERVLSDGQKLMHSAEADMQVARPNRVAVQTATATSRRNLYYNGKKVTLQFPDANYYSSVDYTGTVAELIDRLKANYGVEFPASDLFLLGTPAAPLDNLTSAMNAGQSLIDGVVCDQYAFRQPGIDWQIWISTGPNPLPLKLVITDLTDDARPQSVTHFSWTMRPSFPDSRFTYVPSSSAKAIEMVPVKK